MLVLVLMLESNLLLMLMLMLMLMRSLLSAHCCLSHGSYCGFVSCLCKSVFFALYSKFLVLGFSCQEISITNPNDRCVHVWSLLIMRLDSNLRFRPLSSEHDLTS